MAVYLKRVLVTGMIDAFCELIASLRICFPLFLPWKPNKTKGKQRKSKENHRIQPAPNQRKSKEIKGTKGNQRKTVESTQPQTRENQRTSKETKGNQSVESTQPQTRENQRTSKETKGNRRKRKQIKGYPAVKNARSSDVTKALL